MQQLEPKLTQRATISILLTAAIIITLVLLVFLSPEPAQAVSVTTTPSANSVARGSLLTFTVTINILTTERIPVQNVRLRIFSDSGGATELTSSPYSSPISMSFVASTPPSGYGYGTLYGYDDNVGYGYSFGTGYGYGYTGGLTMVYTCTVTTTSDWAIGTYYVRGDANCGTHTYSSSISAFAVTTAGGGGVVGGGATSAPTPAPTVAPTPVPTTAPTPAPTPVVTDISDKITDEGVVLEEIQVNTFDQVAKLVISAGTKALTATGQPLQSIETVPVSRPPAPPKATIVGLAYDFKPDGATFEPPLTLTMKYNPASIPSGVAEKDLVIAYYDTKTKTWIELECVVDTVNNTITAQVRHFTLFALLAPAPAPTPTPTPVPTPTPTPIPPPPSAAKLNVWLIIGPILGVLLIAAMVIIMIRRRKRFVYVP